MSENVSRRNFVAGSAAVAGVAALAGCTSSTDEGSEATETTEVSYPIDPDGEDVEALYTIETTRDGWIQAVNPDDNPTIGVMDESRIIQVDGYAFRDMNGNGQLDLYEDWRQSAEDRAAALAAELTAEEACALMIHGSIASIGELDEQSILIYSAWEDVPLTLADAMDAGMRTVLNFANSNTSAAIAQWNNRVQEYLEESDAHGIPMNISNNPKTFNFPTNLGLAATFEPDLVHDAAMLSAKAYRSEGCSTLLGVQIDLATEPRWSRIVDTFGEDPALSRDLADAYVSGLQSTYDDDGNDLGWGKDSVINMLKHFPGDGAGESGREAHSAAGKYCVYPGNALETSLINFVDGGLHLTSKTEQTAAFMDSYSIAYTEDESYGELVASAYSEYKNNILREKCEYDGLISTDWGVAGDPNADSYMGATVWGMEDASRAELFAKIINAGVDQVGGDCDVPGILEGYELIEAEMGEEEALERVQNSARRVLRTMFVIGLCECPYVVSTDASSYSESDEIIALAEEANNKSIVMLKNSAGAIQDRSAGKPTVYVPMVPTTDSLTGEEGFGLPVTEETAAEYLDIVTDTLSEDGTTIVRASSSDVAACDFAVVFVEDPSTGSGYTTDDDGNTVYIPISLQYGEYVADGDNVRQVSIAGDIVDGVQENRSYYGQSTVAENLSDLELILEIAELAGDVPVVVCINADHPMIFSEFETEVQGILLGFGSDADVFLPILGGTFEPSGLLPLQQPADMDTVEGQYEDVPRDMECHVDSEGNTYDFAFGLNWSGVIDDDRTATYKVDVLTESEYVIL